MQVDFLIVGQGLAGSLLAWQLMQQRQRVLVVDTGEENASLIAAGLINPVAGMRLVKTDNIECLLAAALACYQQLQRHFKMDFYIEKPMLRLLRNQAENEAAQKRLSDTDYHALLGPLNLDNSEFGVLAQRQTGYLQTRLLLTQLKHYFIINDSLHQSQFDYTQLQINTDSLVWKNIHCQQLIFCEGYHCRSNPWFSWLPLQAVKGEILSLTSPSILPNKIFNYGHWLIPTITPGHYRTGATFNHESLDTIPTEAAKQQLLTSLQNAKLGLIKPNVTAHNANIRPCTLDKQAFIGHHPKQKNLLIFNGFGAKGSLLIPWHSRNLVNHLLTQKTLCPNANISRYYATHFPR